MTGTIINGWTVSSTAASLIFQSGSTYVHDRSGGSIPAASWNPNSTCEIHGVVTTLPAGLTQTFGNLTWNSTNQTTGLIIDAPLDIAGDLTIASTGTGNLRVSGIETPLTVTVGGDFSHSGGEFRLSGSTGNVTMTVGGDFTDSGGEFRLSNSSGTATMTVGGDFNVSGTALCKFVCGSASSSASVLGNVCITGGELRLSQTAGTGTLIVAGDFTHTAGTITETSTGSGSIVFYGSGTQSYTGGGTLANTIDWKVAKASGTLNLATDMTLPPTQTLTLNSGLLSTGSYKVDVANISDGAVTITNGTICGTIEQDMAGTGQYELTGANTYIKPSLPTPCTVTFTCLPGTAPALLNPNGAIQRSYSITLSEALQADLRLQYADDEIPVGVAEADLQLYRNSGSSWELVGGTVTAAGNYVTLTGNSKWSDWAIATEVGLPIQLASFLVRSSSDGMVLQWATVSEVNNYGFYVERRSDGESAFTELAHVFIPGHGTTLSPQHYSYADNTVTPGVWWYRLRQVDLDGTVHYTDAVRATLITGVAEAAPREFVLLHNYPNPFNPSTNIKYALPHASHITLTVFNTLGQIVRELVNGELRAGYHEVQFDAAGLTSGVYFYRMRAGDFVETKRLLLLR